MHELRVVKERVVDHRLNGFITLRLDTSLNVDIITPLLRLFLADLFIYFLGKALSKKKMSILLYFLVAKSVSNPKSNDKYRHLIIFAIVAVVVLVSGYFLLLSILHDKQLLRSVHHISG